MRLLIAEHKAFRVVSRGRRSAREPQDGVYVPVTKVDRWLGNASLKRTVGAGAARTAIRSVPAVRGRGRMPPALFGILDPHQDAIAAARHSSLSCSCVPSGSGAFSGGTHSRGDPAAMSSRATPTWSAPA